MTVLEHEPPFASLQGRTALRKDTLTNPEVQDPRDKLRLTIITTENAEQHQDALEACLRLRARFVKEMGWFDEIRDDTDIYDIDPATIHLAVQPEGSENLAASMRLTKVGSVEGSLSWSMLNTEMSQAASESVDEDGQSTLAKLNASAANGNLWDLTRLVSPMDGSVSGRNVLAGLIQMVGAGIKETCIEGYDADKEDTYWFFNTTAQMKQALDAFGIQNTVIAKGKISPEDTSESYFCVAKPLAAYDFVMNNSGYDFTRKHVTHGLHKAHAL